MWLAECLLKWPQNSPLDTHAKMSTPLTISGPIDIVKDQIDVLIEQAIQQWPKANRTAVENFCWTASDNQAANAWNVKYDAGLYNWNKDTVLAIIHVLRGVNKI